MPVSAPPCACFERRHERMPFFRYAQQAREDVMPSEFYEDASMLKRYEGQARSASPRPDAPSAALQRLLPARARHVRAVEGWAGRCASSPARVRARMSFVVRARRLIILSFHSVSPGEFTF